MPDPEPIILRGDYCKNGLVCTTRVKNPAQAGCMSCDYFSPIFSRVDPLARAKQMGFFKEENTVELTKIVETTIDRTGQKKCSSLTCTDPWQPADAKHFFRNKNSKDGLSSSCKTCHKKHFSAKAKKEAASTQSATEHLPPGRIIRTPTPRTLIIEFGTREMFWDDLILDADDNFRTPENHLLWLAHQTLYRENFLPDKYPLPLEIENG